MSRTRRSVLNVVAGAAASAVMVLVGFVATPFLVDWLGDERYGAFRAAADWFGYLTLLEFGVRGALLALYARALGRDDRSGLVAAVRAGVRAYLGVAVTTAIVGAGLATALPDLVRAPPRLVSELRAGAWVYLLSIVWLPLAAFRPMTDAAQRGYLVHLLGAARTIATAAAAVGFAAAGWGLIGQFLAVAIGPLPFYLGLAWDAARRYPEVLARRSAGEGLGRELRSLSAPTFLFDLAGRLSLLTDNILVALFLGPAAVAPFFLTQRAVAAAGAQAQALGAAAWAGLIDLHFRGEHDRFAHRLAQLTRLTAVAAVALLLPVAVWNRPLITLWIGAGRYAGGTVTWLAAGNAAVLAVVSLWGWPLSAAGLVRALLPCMLAATAVNVAVSVAATAALGLPGPLVGTAVAFAGVSWWWLLRLLRRHFGTPARHLLAAAARPAAVAVPYAAVLVLLAEAVPAYDPAWPRQACWAALAGWLAAAASGYLALAWFLALGRGDRAEWLRRLRG